jgi:hypothetical protein
MHIWKTIRALPDCTPVPVDLALEALRPSSPKALLLRLYNAGHLLEELEPDAIMKWSREALAEMGAATHQFDKRLSPAESLTPYLSDPSSWARLYILREELLVVRVALRLESLRAARRARLAKAPPVVTKTSPAPGEKKNGRKPSQLRLGIAAFYLKRRESGEVAILLPGAISVFMEELRRHVNDPEVYDETKAHLRKLTKQSSKWRVFVHDPEEIDGKPRKNNEKPGGYEQSDVSAILTALRKQYPVE